MRQAWGSGLVGIVGLCCSNDSLLPSLKGYAIQDELRLQLMNWGEYTIKIMPQFIS